MRRIRRREGKALPKWEGFGNAVMGMWRRRRLMRRELKAEEVWFECRE